MTGAQAFGPDQARITPITVAGVLAILGLSGVLAASVLQGGAGGTSAPRRIGPAGARSQTALAAPSTAVTQPAVVPVPSGGPVISTPSVPVAGGTTAAVAGRAGLSPATVTPAHAAGSSQLSTSIPAASGSTTRTGQTLRPAQSAPASGPAAQLTRTATGAGTAMVGGELAPASSPLRAAQDQVLGGAATPTTGASLGIEPMTGVSPSTDSGSPSGSGSGVPVNTNPPFPSIQPYIGPISTQAEAMMALGLPATFQFGAEPDPYIVGSYQSFVTDAAQGDKAAQAGLQLAVSQGANFSGFN
jgi:hypothetical protein